MQRFESGTNATEDISKNVARFVVGIFATKQIGNREMSDSGGQMRGSAKKFFKLLFGASDAIQDQVANTGAKFAQQSDDIAVVVDKSELFQLFEHCQLFGDLLNNFKQMQMLQFLKRIDCCPQQRLMILEMRHAQQSETSQIGPVVEKGMQLHLGGPVVVVEDQFASGAEIIRPTSDQLFRGALPDHPHFDKLPENNKKC